MKSRINVHTRVRPLRIGFLVSPTDRASVQRVISYNTILWGGRFNPIIPIYKRAPKGWPKSLLGTRLMNARDVAKGYVSAFEPDLYVDIAGNAAEFLSLESDLVVTEDKFADWNSEQVVKYGLPVSFQYRAFYDRVLQFKQKHPAKYALPRAEKHSQRLLVSAWRGVLPDEGPASQYHALYRGMFDPQEIVVGSSNAYEMTCENIRGPLDATSLYLRSPRPRELMILFLNPTSTIDVIDFWNLRALGYRVLPLTPEWADSQEQELRDFVERQYHTHPHNPQYHIGTTLQCSFAADEEQWDHLLKRMRFKESFKLVGRKRMPRVWDEVGRDADHVTRLDVFDHEIEEELFPDDRFVHLRDKAPSHTDGGWDEGRPRWVNEIRLDRFSGESLASDFPASLSSVQLRRFFHDFRPVTTSSDGLVFRVVRADDRRFFELLPGERVFEAWAESIGRSYQISGAGRVAAQAVRAVGGLRETAVLAGAKLISCLNDLSHSDYVEDAGRRERGRSRVGSINRNSLREILKQSENSQWPQGPDLWLRDLVDMNVIQVGAVMQCPHCLQRNWVKVSELKYSHECERCIQEFAFPSADPVEVRWEYRPIGPFTVENYAQGAYSSVLALRFLLISCDLRGRTWSPAFELRDEQVREFDFGAFVREGFAGDKLHLILGEAKSGGETIKAKDVRLCRWVVENLPQTTMVIAINREYLNNDEKRRLAPVARAGRKSVGGETWRMPVIILTGLELYADQGPPYCWAGHDRYRPHMERPSTPYGPKKIQWLANVTQQLHLDMESAEEELVKRSERRREQLLRKMAGT